MFGPSAIPGKRLSWLAVLALVAACASKAEPIDYCLEDPANCPACESDDQCFWSGNNCYDTVYCVSEGTDLAHPMLGCSKALEHPWPEAEACACVASTCQYVE